MAVEIFAYTTTDEKNKLEKTLTQKRYYIGAFRDEVDVLNPVIRLQVDIDSEEWDTDRVPNFNYIFCPELERYYFVSNIKLLRSNLFEISCHVDVLMTYKDQIRACSGILDRSQMKYNTYINDDLINIMSYTQPKIIKFPTYMATPTMVLNVLSDGDRRSEG